MAKLKTVVLRFSDYEGPTIQLHVDVREQLGSVWWGWWKRGLEGARVDVLKELATKELPLRVGLANTMDKEYLVAQCLSIEFGQNGERIPAPDRKKTPDYYGDE